MLLQQPPRTDFRIFLHKARSLDLSPIANQLMRSPGFHWNKTSVTEALTHYLAFLYLVDTYPHLQLVPTQAIDEVWHQHILDTRKYEEDCQTLFGHFIHHFPYFGIRDANDHQTRIRAYTLTQFLCRKHFGNAIANAWNTIPADCEPLHAVSSEKLYVKT